jgi:hypothetical protein
MTDPYVGKFVAGVGCFGSNPVSTDFVWLVCPFWPLFAGMIGSILSRLGADGRIDVK